MGKPLISVVIPNYNRADALPETLSSLAAQSLPLSDFEVILVDDGSLDHSVPLVTTLQRQLPLKVRLIKQDRRGPAAARNLGARAASGSVVLFWDSDMIAAPQALSEHARLQDVSGPALVAGARRPWPQACTTAFAGTMCFATLDEDQFAGKTPSFQEMLSSNLSVARENLAALGGFDESLRAYEDIDLAYRAQKAGMTLLFSREALGYHNHPMTLAQACRQQRHYQRCAVALLRKHPELAGQIQHLQDKWPIDWSANPPQLVLRKLARQATAASPMLQILEALVATMEKIHPDPRLLSWFYWKVLASYQLIGFREGLDAENESA